MRKTMTELWVPTFLGLLQQPSRRRHILGESTRKLSVQLLGLPSTRCASTLHRPGYSTTVWSSRKKHYSHLR